jgi:serine/threonine-protein kinase HipA
MPASSLQVWLDDLHVADLQRRAAGDLRCAYTDDALTRWAGNSPIVSCSLPLQPGALPADAFFRGLLPEGRALESLAAQADLKVSDTFGLLARYGRDIAGALIIGDDPPAPHRYGVESYSDTSLGEEVAELDVRPLAVRDDSELSIAGLQNKLLLVRLHDGSWGRPIHGQPSTHILKVDPAARPGLVEAEAHCLALAHAVGLTTIDPSLRTFGAQQCLIVSRFDRRQTTNGLERIHQEDLCQATGGTDKYQSRRRGGPGFADAARILERHATHVDEQLHRLLAVATFTLAIGNADAHGKNLSFLHDQPETVVVAPLYDTVPTIMWPSLRTDAAMSLDGRYSLINSDRHDLVNEAKAWPLAERAADEVVSATLEAILENVDDVFDDGSALQRTVRQRTRNLLAGSVAGPAASDRRSS